MLSLKYFGKKNTDLEIQNNYEDQYGCRNNVEISGIPQSVSNNHLEEKRVDVLKAIDVNFTSNEIEACHCLEKKKMLLIGLLTESIVTSTAKWEKKIKFIDKNALAIPNARLLASKNLTPANSKLTFNCLKFKGDGEIEECYTINGIVRITKNSKLMRIYHLRDLQELFPEYMSDSFDHAELFIFVFCKFLCYYK